MGSVDQTASVLVRVPGALNRLVVQPGPAYLLVIENDSMRVVHLPATGQFVIGRSSDVELQLTHGSVSRRHAAIRIDHDNVLRVADLGSHNRTRVNGAEIQEWHTLASGDVVLVGEVTLVVHVSTTGRPVGRETYGEAGWRRRLAEEMDRAITFRRTLAVIALDGVDASALSGLGDTLRMIDVLGVDSDGHALLLLPEVAREQATAIAKAAVESIAARVPNVRAGVALCPHDAADANTILFSARKAAKSAKPGTVAEAGSAAKYVELGDRRVLYLDPAMSRVYSLLERLAPSQLPVLITGENGVGKENAAYAVHYWSKRSGPFVAQNCGGIHEATAESTLFGHDKGAFTGAAVAKPGLFEAAAGGTVFLDEIGDLPLAIQVKLLRALEAKTITRLGETRERAIDIRLVAATNRDLNAMVKAGTFREDLLHRIAGATVVLPPLRDRCCEIPLLARQFLDEACSREKRPPKVITPEAMQVLLTYHWPGNVRELRNEMNYVAVAAPDDHVEPSDFQEKLGGASQAMPSTTGPVEALNLDPPATFRPIADELRELERRRMAEALVAANGVKTRAAQLIEMPIRTFTLKLKQYKL